ncbi:UvrD-helicase domain-containing protein [Streptomyces cinerochromogenes]|uniref:UvrD-helicase domain-containing protein n=1 Tax=Streptomyces cinerochromogenes TaxID=66422 RepID=UPI00339DD5E8
MIQARSGITTAEEESEKALSSILAALESRSNFKLEAGAGAGKTTSLINALQRILGDRSKYLPRDGQRVACVTYTNVARNEIIRRTDASPYVFADTIHGFLWHIISPFSKALLREIPTLPKWDPILDGSTPLQGVTVAYDLGFRGIKDDVILLHHDDVPALAARLFSNRKFRSLVADRFPIIFIDEYQDTPAGLAEAMLSGVKDAPAGSTHGFFGDHWQQIYDGTCGSIDHLPVTSIQKNANWRSSSAVVHLLNEMRPELPQAPVADAKPGTVLVYHTNHWVGPRGTHSKKGQIPDSVLTQTLKWVEEDALRRYGSGQGERPKILMLTHSSIASELGFGGVDRAFRYNEDYVRKRDEVVAFLLDAFEPACEHFQNKQYGPMFEILKRSRPRMQKRSDKTGWVALFTAFESARTNGTVGDVLDLILAQNYFAPPQAVYDRQRKWERALKEQDSTQNTELPRRLAEYGKFRSVRYREVMALRQYVEENTPFSTQHGVKGAEYPTVLAVFGGWTLYNFPRMLADFPNRKSLDGDDLKRFQRSRNLFYVASSRARENLIALFTTELPKDALQTLESWVGTSNMTAVPYGSEGELTSP